MGFFDTIYIITEEKLDSNLVRQQWFWDKDEAEQFYQNQLDIEDRIITLYAFDLRDTIEDTIRGLMSNRHSSLTPTPLQEIRSSRKAADEGSWTDLEYRPEGYFYIERINSPDYWPFKVEPYGDSGSWRVVDATVGTPMAIIHPYISDGNAVFKVTVNGFSRTTPFVNLTGAVKFAITEFNG